MRVKMKQEEINSTHGRQARNLPCRGRQEGVGFCDRRNGRSKVNYDVIDYYLTHRRLECPF